MNIKPTHARTLAKHLVTLGLERRENILRSLPTMDRALVLQEIVKIESNSQ
mgnify:CR=1 FL=1